MTTDLRDLSAFLTVAKGGGFREAARTSGDYAKSDALRKELLERFGIQVKDTKDGTRWERVGRKGA